MTWQFLSNGPYEFSEYDLDFPKKAYTWQNLCFI